MDSSPSTQTRIHVVFAAVGAAVLLGLLMAVPSCNKFMRQRQVFAIQSAARADLQFMIDRENDFFQKNGFYTTDLEGLSLDAPKKLVVLYKFGFVRAGSDAPAKAIALDGHEFTVDSARKDLDALLKVSPKLEVVYSPTTQLDTVEFGKLGSYCQDCTATKNSFKLITAANLDEDPVLDVWTVDEKGIITHVVNDLN
jgi:hypothetical protein